MKIKNILLALSLMFLFSQVALVVPLFAKDDPDQSAADEIQEDIEKYEKKIKELQSREQTLANEIEYADDQIYLAELKIQSSSAKIKKTKDEITKISGDISDLGLRIDKLVASIEYQQKILESRMRESYKSKDDSMVLLFGTNNVGKMIQKLEYLQVMEKNDNRLLEEMRKTKETFTTQKRLFEEKKTQEEELKKQLEVEKAELDAQKGSLEDKRAEKKKLLELTQNDEAKYQQLLQEAQDELASFKGFTTTAGGGVVGHNALGKGKEGWYYSQRDTEWAATRIGRSSESILNVGCLVTSIAMVYKSEGKDIDPADVAKDSSRFFSSTAMMLIPWKGPVGKYTSISVSQIDNELTKRPVIVGLYAGPYGTHFIVLSEKKDGDYIMYDPWYGPDLKFSSRYSKGSIFQAVVFK